MSVPPSPEDSVSHSPGPHAGQTCETVSNPGREPALRPPAIDNDALARHDAGQLPVNLAEGSFGSALAPALIHTCQNRLKPIRWFRTDWQRGGAITGYSDYTTDDGRTHPVVVKLPVPPCERLWLTQLQPAQDVVPRVFAHGEAINGYDFAWVVMERLPYGPLGAAWGGAAFDLLAQVAGRFYHASRHIPPTGRPLTRDWAQICDLARKSVQQHHLPDAQRWSKALKKANRKLKNWLKQWDDRPLLDWCHGDLHLGNAMSRHAPDPNNPQNAESAHGSTPGPALLIDFAETRIGHWVEDAVYFEHLYWARKDRLEGRRLCSLIAQERKKHDLPVGENWPKLADIKRALLAMSTPAQLRHDGDPAHVAAALQVLERTVN